MTAEVKTRTRNDKRGTRNVSQSNAERETSLSQTRNPKRLLRREEQMSKNQKTPVEIQEAKGKLGVLLVGMGAVSTTFVAGVEAIKRGLAEPIGSLTQMGTIRLCKRTDNR